MSRQKLPQRLLPSLLDRLIDEEPGVSTEPEWAQSQSLEMLKQAVQRDLEALLNTKQLPHDGWEDLTEAEKSILTFGLPDMGMTIADSPNSHEWVRRAVELAITRFEPRLTDVRVNVVPSENPNDRQLRLQIDARLRIEPTPEPVRFDTVMRQDSGQCLVRATS